MSDERFHIFRKIRKTLTQSLYPRTWLKPFSTQAIKDGVNVFKQLVGYTLFEMTISQLYVPCSSVVALID